MFGVDFSELLVILIVALIVVGPERLPKVARTFGHLWGRLQRYVNSVKTDISREMAAEEFRQMQQKINQEVMSVEREANLAILDLDQPAQQPDGAGPQTAAATGIQDGTGARQAHPGPAPEQNKS